MSAAMLGLGWQFSQNKWLLQSMLTRVLLLQSVMRLPQYLPFLGGRCGATDDDDSGDEEECGQNVSLENDEGSGEEGRGRSHAAWAAATTVSLAIWTNYVVVDVVTACVTYIMFVLFVRSWTSCGRIVFRECGNVASTTFRVRRRRRLCLLSHDCFLLLLPLLGSPLLSFGLCSRGSMFLAPFQLNRPLRRGQAASAEPGSGCGRRGRGNGGGVVVGSVGRM